MEFYASICRLCESPDQTGNNWIELFSGKSESLLAKIRACANIAISAHDGLPERICGRCNLSLDHAYSFKIRCETTDAKLRHELDFLYKRGEDHGEPVPPFDYSRFLVPQDGTKQDAILAAEKVYVKTELVEDEDYCSATVETQLKVEQDPDTKEDKHKISDEEGSDIESDGGEESENPQPDEVGKKIPHVCDFCGEQFGKRTALIYHKKVKHPKQRYQCKQCSKQFTRKLYLEEHEVQHTGVRPYECPQCDRKYFTSSGLRCHLTDHGDNLPYVCDKCAKGFSTESKLRVHYAVHIEERNFMCDTCDKTFKTLGVLNKHKTTHLPQGHRQRRKDKPRKKKDYVCQYCGKISTHPGVHNMHTRTHTGEQRFECHICLKRFTSYGSHKKHLLVHIGEKPHVCQYCQKAFRQKHHMDTHIRGVHTKEKPYKCKFCPKAFATLGNMREHEKNHGESGRKPEPASENSGTMVPPEFGHFLAESANGGGSY